MRQAVPPRHHEPQWKAVLRREWLAVDRIGEEDLVALCLRQAQASLVVLLDPTLDTAIQAGEDDLGGPLERPGLVEQRSQRRARPLGGPDRLEEPWLAERARGKGCAGLSGALPRHGPGARRAAPEAGQRPGAVRAH